MFFIFSLVFFETKSLYVDQTSLTQSSASASEVQVLKVYSSNGSIFLKVTYLCTCGNVCHSIHMESENNLWVSTCIPCGSQASNPGHWAWWQGPLPIKLPRASFLFFSETGFHYVAQVSIRFVTILSQPTKVYQHLKVTLALTPHGEWVTRKSFQEACLHTLAHVCINSSSQSGKSLHYCKGVTLWWTDFLNSNFLAINDGWLVFPWREDSRIKN